MTTAEPLRSRRLFAPVAGAIAVAGLPKCPLCVMAYLGLTGSAGLAAAYSVWLLPATLATLALTLAVMVRGRADSRALLTALSGSAALLAGRQRDDLPILLYLGAAALLLAAVLTLRPRRRASACSCDPSPDPASPCD